MVFWRKSHPIIKQMDAYLAKLEECVDLMGQSFDAYAEHGLGSQFDELTERTHIAESTCDDLRRDLETSMFEKALIPESRGDILDLLEALDKIPNQCESVLFHIQMQLLVIPEAFLGKFAQLLHLNQTACRTVAEAARVLLKDTSKTPPLLAQVDKDESASDRLEREMIRSVFASNDVPGDQKILLRDQILEFGKIANRCENAADRIQVIAAKRLI